MKQQQPININDDEYIAQPLGSYRGNSLLKQIGEQINWTPEMIVEYQRCSKDPIYFIEKHVKIVHLDEGLVPFVLRDYQKEMVQSIKDNRFSVFATARQTGKCFSLNTPIRIRNKKTGDIVMTTIGDFYEKTKNSKM